MAAFRLIAAAVSLACAAFAGEYAMLANGFTIRVDRHEFAGDKVRLYANGGVTEMPRASVVSFEPEFAAPAAPPAGPLKEKPADPKQLVEEAAKRHGLPPRFLHSLARAESGYRQSAVSPKGAVGIMQLMPETARQFGADPADPRQNVEAGARYLADLLRKYAADDYQVRKALAAYNAGPGAVAKYNGVPPYSETVAYVERVIKQSGLRKRRPAQPAAAE